MSQMWWDTDQVAEYLGINRQAIYDSRARGKFPGNRGHRRGKRLLFIPEVIAEGRGMIEDGEDPDLTEETTGDPMVAILWELQGIHKTLKATHNELRRGSEYTITEAMSITLDIEEEE